MRTHNIRRGQLALLVVLGLSSVACGGDKKKKADDDLPDLIVDGGDDNNGGNNNNNNGNNNGGDDAGPTSGGGNAGDDGGVNSGEDCVRKPKSSSDFLNSCAPEGVVTADFDNSKRLPPKYRNGTLPKFP